MTTSKDLKMEQPQTKLGLVGLGKMGSNMLRRWHQAGLEVVGFDQNAQVRAELAESVGAGVTITGDLTELIDHLGAAGQRAVWMMVPAGDITEQVLTQLLDRLAPDDIVVDGGNSNFNDTKRRAEQVKERGLYLLDVGTSGGVWGLAEGYALMIGGEKSAVDRLRPYFEVLAPAPDRGWGHMGPSGSGHYVKMVHNGIEYGMMQAYAEGFELMSSKSEFELDLGQIAELWRHGSVVRSWLLDLTADALNHADDLDQLSDYVSDSGEGRWTMIDSIEQGVPTPVITLATQMRFRSQQDLSYAGQLLSAMRRAFGGHAVQKVQKVEGGDNGKHAE